MVCQPSPNTITARMLCWDGVLHTPVSKHEQSCLLPQHVEKLQYDEHAECSHDQVARPGVKEAAGAIFDVDLLRDEAVQGRKVACEGLPVHDKLDYGQGGQASQGVE